MRHQVNTYSLVKNRETRRKQEERVVLKRSLRKYSEKFYVGFICRKVASSGGYL